MLTSRFRPDPRLIAKVLALLVIVVMYSLRPAPLFRAASTRAPMVASPVPAVRTPAGAVKAPSRQALTISRR